MARILLVIGHRGAPIERPENTLESFREAIRQGADGVELDVRLNRDGDLVVWHDPVICSGEDEVAIHEADLAELRKFDLTEATDHPTWTDPEAIAVLDQVLDATGDSLVDVELKNLPGEPLVDAGHRLASLVAGSAAGKGAIDRVIVTSFWSDALDAVRREAPAIRTGWLLIPGVSPIRVLDDAVGKGYDLLLPFDTSLDLGDNSFAFETVRDAGLQTWAWTVNDRNRMQCLIEAGIDGIITDRPAQCVDLLR